MTSVSCRKMRRGRLLDLPFRYPPFEERGLRFMRWLFKASPLFRLLRRLVF